LQIDHDLLDQIF
jgi:hypothetical protein